MSPPEGTAVTHYLISVYPYGSAAVSVETQNAPRMTQIGAFNDEIIASGNFVFAGGLLGPAAATVVKATHGAVTMTDGPFVETHEALGGFWVIEAADLDEALAIAARATIACGAPLEVRPFDGIVDA